MAEERTLTRLYPTESLSESRSDSVFCLKLVVVIFLFLREQHPPTQEPRPNGASDPAILEEEGADWMCSLSVFTVLY